MYVGILALLISGFITVTFADSAAQTDWSGGPGVVGPVITLGNDFCLDTDVFYCNPCELVLQTGLEHIVGGQLECTWSIYSADVDGDGDMDILGGALDDGFVTWWENNDGSGISWTEHTVDSDFWGAISVHSADVDGDGYLDVLGAARYADPAQAWWDLTEYLPDGSLESSIFYVQSDPDWQWIDWTCTTPPGTSISFQVRASDDYTNMGAWSDTLSYPSDLEGILIDDDSYFQYRTIMQTTYPAAAPVLNDITISWDPVCIWETTEPIHPAIALLSIAPNSSVGSPVIRFGLPEASYVSIFIFDLSGRLVRSACHGD